jgi:4-amino-4-deoxy-L-arabinose transferase-like glycosyltransferase
MPAGCPARTAIIATSQSGVPGFRGSRVLNSGTLELETLELRNSGTLELLEPRNPGTLRVLKRTAVTGTGLFVGTLLLYGTALTHSPPYLHEAEVLFALHAHAIATTAHDMYGRLLPLYFQMQPIGDNVWFHPALVYVTAAFLKVLPYTEWAIRLPSVFVAATSVVLLYAIARRVFGRERDALLAAIMLAVTPAHFVNSRIAMDYVYPIPFVLGWLLCLLAYVERPRPVTLFLGTSLLGIGVYSYIASLVMMPLYLVLSWLTLYLTGERARRPYVLAAAGFAWPLLVLPLWLSQHPAVFAETLSRYGVADADVLANLRGKPLDVILEELRRPLRFSGLAGRVSLYWYFFDPAFLFLSGGYANPVNSTRHVGVFLLPFLALVPLGLWRLLSPGLRPANLIVALGFVSAPLAACLVVPEPYAIDREMAVVPFGVLVATAGLTWLLADLRAWRRWAGVSLLVLAAAHFVFFLTDYYGDYRGRAAFWFNKNHRGALEEVVTRAEHDQPPAIYLSSGKDPYIDAYWRLTLIKHGKESFLARTVYFNDDTLDVSSVPARSVLVATPDDKRLEALVASGALRRLVQIPEPADPPHFSILTR